MADKYLKIGIVMREKLFERVPMFEERLVHISNNEYPNIYKKHDKKNRNISINELEDHIDAIITWLMQNGAHSITVDLDGRNKELGYKKMTVDEVKKIAEEAIGEKIKIVERKEK